MRSHALLVSWQECPAESKRAREGESITRRQNKMVSPDRQAPCFAPMDYRPPAPNNILYPKRENIENAQALRPRARAK